MGGHDLPVDVVIVGAGATGSWCARTLTSAGLKVRLLDAGPSLTRGDAAPVQWTLESRMTASRRQPVQATHPSYWAQDPTLYVDDFDHPYESLNDPKFTWIRGRQIGGRSLMWGGITIRFSDREFQGSIRSDARTPWPLSVDELRPHYEQVERVLGVEGPSEVHSTFSPGIFLPPHPLTAAELRFKRVVEKFWHDRRVLQCPGVTASSAVLANVERRGNPLSVLHAVLPAALETGCLDVRADSIASHLIISGRRVHGVACVDRVTKRPFEVFGRAVVLCASTLESVRIMLNSKCGAHPNGVGNSSGLLGTHLCDHAAVTLSGVIPGSEDHPVVALGFGAGHGILIPPFQDPGSSDDGDARMFSIWGCMQRGTRNKQGEAGWFLNGVSEVVARKRNLAYLQPGHRDAWGVPVLAIDFEYSDDDRAALDRAEIAIREMAAEADLTIDARRSFAPGGYVHEVGGARMGFDRRTSVLNSHGQCWDSDNLFVLDGSSFVSAGWQNPTLTMMALAVRGCGALVRCLAQLS